MSLKTIQEKMLAGEVYNCLEPELDAIRQVTKVMLRRFNQAETLAERQAILQQFLGHFGQDAIIEPPFYCPYGHNIYIGDYSYLNVFCTILDGNQVRIGKHVMIGPHVQIYTPAHMLQAEPRIQGYEVAKAITIEDNVWIGGGAILLPGVSIGRNAVVGAGSVVTRSVPANMVVAGNPARVIREIEQTQANPKGF
jgi:maltose O-acetyltransferase